MCKIAHTRLIAPPAASRTFDVCSLEILFDKMPGVVLLVNDIDGRNIIATHSLDARHGVKTKLPLRDVRDAGVGIV